MKHEYILNFIIIHIRVYDFGFFSTSIFCNFFPQCWFSKIVTGINVTAMLCYTYFFGLCICGQHYHAVRLRMSQVVKPNTPK